MQIRIVFILLILASLAFAGEVDSSAVFRVDEIRYDIGDAFDDSQGKKVVRLLRLNKIYPEHKINYEDDYYRIKQFTTRYKEQDVLVDWVKKQIPDAFIKIGDDYKDCSFAIDWEQKNRKRSS